MRFRLKLFLAVFTGMALAIGCSLEDWDFTWTHHRIGSGYDGSLEFSLLEPDESIEPRSGHASVVFKDAIWVFGGYNPNARGDRSSYLSDVWFTKDGHSWHNVTQDAPWKGRRGHQVVVFDDALYLIGGYRVYTKDGVSYGGGRQRRVAVGRWSDMGRNQAEQLQDPRDASLPSRGRRCPRRPTCTILPTIWTGIRG